jgi:SHS family lactate transporter-like MFS transporter
MAEKSTAAAPVAFAPGEMPPKLPWGFERAKRHLIGIFVAPDGWYYNEEGISLRLVGFLLLTATHSGKHVYGKLQRPPLQNPFKVTGLSANRHFGDSNSSLKPGSSDAYRHGVGDFSRRLVGLDVCSSP